MTTTYSLPEAAEILCGASDDAALYWLAQRLRGSAHPRLEGYKAQRRWRMNQDQLDENIRRLTPAHSEVPEIPVPSSMMRRSRRRLVS